ncbi:hypothetical protein CGMCC3_g10043 [Colletotrichum fructicola]|nr:uncharacterized protein CGMCC3_g10043 [Colletotrichum fructicola]KAE9573754.1 hypothetical protein CGMCC3_g10043 [Colletotrichum fructicola]
MISSPSSVTLGDRPGRAGWLQVTNQRRYLTLELLPFGACGRIRQLLSPHTANHHYPNFIQHTACQDRKLLFKEAEGSPQEGIGGANLQTGRFRHEKSPEIGTSSNYSDEQSFWDNGAAGHEDEPVLEGLGPLKETLGSAENTVSKYVELETVFPQREPSSFQERIEAWIADLRTSRFEDPELVGPFPGSFTPQAPLTPAQLDKQGGSQFREDSFRSRIENLTKQKESRPRSEAFLTSTLHKKDARSTTSTTSSTNLPIMTHNSDKLEKKGRTMIPSAIQGTFIPVSPRKRGSPSPMRHKPNKSVQINLNLTENQVERLTDVFASKSESPSRRARAGNTARTGSPERNNNFASTHATSRAHAALDQEEPHAYAKSGQATNQMAQKGHDSDSTTFSELMPRSPHKTHKAKSSMSSNIAERRRQNTLTPINIEDRRQYATLVGHGDDMVAASSPTSDNPSPATPDEEESSSIYSRDAEQPSPLRIHKNTSQQVDSVLQSYSGWKNSNPHTTTVPTGASDVDSRGVASQRQAPPKGRLEALRQPAMDAGQLYSPLRPYFAYKDLPVQKIADQKSPDRKKKDTSPKKPGLLDSLKKIAKEMTESKPSRKVRDVEREGKVKRITISLDPREQSLLYCELEFHISNALHSYITNELNHGRLNPDKLKKIADGWNQKGRPRVVGFRYDLETQLDLVHLHIDEFRFFGRRQGNHLEIAGLLHAMKVNARALRIRTFCQPDSVIAKQLVDSQSLCNTIGCSEAQQIAIAEIAQFFKVIVEREQAYREKLARDNTPKTLPHGQGDRQWEPSKDLAEGMDPYGRLHLIPDGYDVNSEALRFDN